MTHEPVAAELHEQPTPFLDRSPARGLLARLRDTAPLATPIAPPPVAEPFASFIKNEPPPAPTPGEPIRLRPKKPKPEGKKGGRKKSPWAVPEPAGPTVEERILELAKTEAGRQLLRKLFRNEAAKSNFAEFVRQAWHVVEPATKLNWNWHHQLMCCVLQALFMDWLKAQRVEGHVNKIRNAVFNVPPGSLKSRIISVCFHAWVWLHWPGLKLICLSVNEDAAMRDARAARDLIKSPWYIETFKPSWPSATGEPRVWTLKGDQDAISNYGNSVSGERLSMPSKAEIVGLRGDIILIDDPNNPKKSENKKERDEVNELWSTNQYNRVNDLMRSLRIGVQQRTNAGDWTGNVIELQGTWSDSCEPCNSTGKIETGDCKKCGGLGHNNDGWLHVVIPAEADLSRSFVMPEHLLALLREWLSEDEIVRCDPRTADGDVLDPVRQPLSVLIAERKRWEGTGNYVGQMLQAPALVEGLLVQRAWWSFCRLAAGVRETVDELPTGRPRPAFCHGKDGVPHEAQVIHVKHHSPDEWDFDWITISVDCAAKKTTKGSNWGILVIAGKGGRRYVLDDRTQRGALHEIIAIIVDLIQLWRPDTILVEDKAAGPDVMDTLRERMGSGDIPMVSIESAEPGNDDKEMRLQACIHYIINGFVHLLDGATWLHEFVEELSLFPNGLRDDRVDSLSQCLNHKRPADDEWPD